MVSVVSLFSGCGGLDIGFHNNFFNLKVAFDNDPAAIKCLTYNLNTAGKVVDVTSVEFDEELKATKAADVVLGGFPCQGFSKAGPKNTGDPRNQLYLSMLKAVEKLKPKIFIGENVDGLAQNYNGTFVNKIIADFEQIGYSVEYRIINAVNFGVPQYRRRIIFVGVKKNAKGKFEWPVPTHYGSTRNGEFKTEWDVFQSDLFQPLPLERERSIEDAIGDLLKKTDQFPDHKTVDKLKPNDLAILKEVKAGQKLCNVRFSDTSVYTWNIPTVFGDTSAKEKTILETIGKNRRKKIYGLIPNGNPLPATTIRELSGLAITDHELDSLVERKFLRKWDGKYDLTGAMFCSGLYKRPSWKEPSPTVLTVFDNPRYFAHPLKDRPFTVRECARLQSFPDNFKFLESGIKVGEAYRLIGNAVPPLLSISLATSVKKYFEATFKSYENKRSVASVK